MLLAEGIIDCNWPGNTVESPRRSCEVLLCKGMPGITFCICCLKELTTDNIHEMEELIVVYLNLNIQKINNANQKVNLIRIHVDECVNV